jgi:hypothetical protein
MSDVNTQDPLGIGGIERRVVELAREGRCYGACIHALAKAWHAEHREKYGEHMTDPSPQAVWRHAAEKAEAALTAAQARCERLAEALHRISLASQNSMSSKTECGQIARAALEEPKR